MSNAHGVPAPGPGGGSSGSDAGSAPAAGPDSGGRRHLLVGGRAVLAYTPAQQERPTADDADVLTTRPEAVAAVLDQLPGWWLTSPDLGLVDALLAAGATVVRHAHLYSRPITPADTALEVGLAGEVRVGPISRPAAELAGLSALAYGPDHVDHLPGGVAEEAAELALLLSGELVGPLITEASFQVTSGDRVVGLIVVNRSPDPPPNGGPWLSQVCRHPDPAWAGLGHRLVERAIGALATAGETTLGLAVTEGNPAQRIYQRLGFAHLASRRKLAIPG